MNSVLHLRKQQSSTVAAGRSPLPAAGLVVKFGTTAAAIRSSAGGHSRGMVSPRPRPPPTENEDAPKLNNFFHQ
jgi:hypothetical protein